MFRPRVIPVLLLKNKGLVKSIKFSKYRYIGDPINAVRIFNDLKADELTILDILASKENRCISIDFVRKIGEEANMPFAVGGGITCLNQIQKIIGAGAEKVIINTAAHINSGFIKSAANTFGSSTIAVCIDVKRNFFGKKQAWILGGKKPTGMHPLEYSKKMADNGAGEIIIQSIERDGIKRGYDINLLKAISETVSIPVVALGGAGNLHHMYEAYHEAHVTGLAAGSMFVYLGARNGILINYPEKEKIKEILVKSFAQRNIR